VIETRQNVLFKWPGAQAAIGINDWSCAVEIEAFRDLRRHRKHFRPPRVNVISWATYRCARAHRSRFGPRKSDEAEISSARRRIKGALEPRFPMLAKRSLIAIDYADSRRLIRDREFGGNGRPSAAG